jgi:hypothetical protein
MEACQMRTDVNNLLVGVVISKIGLICGLVGVLRLRMR